VKVYIVDASISMDNDFGYNSTHTELPYDGYLGRNLIDIAKWNPASLLELPAIGISIAAFFNIQDS